MFSDFREVWSFSSLKKLWILSLYFLPLTMLMKVPILIHCFSFPGGSNQSLLQKFNDNHGNHENYNKTQIQENAFEIIHYAGPVQYRIDVSYHTVIISSSI